MRRAYWIALLILPWITGCATRTLQKTSVPLQSIEASNLRPLAGTYRNIPTHVDGSAQQLWGVLTGEWWIKPDSDDRGDKIIIGPVKKGISEKTYRSGRLVSEKITRFEGDQVRIEKFEQGKKVSESVVSSQTFQAQFEREHAMLDAQRAEAEKNDRVMIERKPDGRLSLKLWKNGKMVSQKAVGYELRGDRLLLEVRETSSVNVISVFGSDFVDLSVDGKGRLHVHWNSDYAALMGLLPIKKNEEKGHKVYDRVK